jgi:hypothetical protein
MEEKKSLAETIPKVSGVISFDESKIYFKLALGGLMPDPSYGVIARIRDNAQVGQAGVFSTRAMVDANGSVTLSLSRYLIAGERFQYQLGVEFNDAGRPFFSRWIDAGQTDH